MDAHPLLPAKLTARMRELDHDLQRARENLRAGKLRPDQLDKLAGILDARLGAMEAEVSARLLYDAAHGSTPRRVLGAN